MRLRQKILLLLAAMLALLALVMGVILALVLPQDVVADRLGLLLLLLIVAALLVLGGGVLVLEGLVLRPIRQLNQAVSQMGTAGAVPLPTLGDDEIAQLGRTVGDALTRLQEARGDLKQSETQLRTLVEHAPVMLFALDAAGTFTLMEGRGLDALGISPGQHVGHAIFNAFADNQFLLEDARRVLRGETFTNLVNFGDQAFDIHYSAVRDPGGTVGGAVCVAVNATERVQTEEALRFARDAAEAASQAKSTFLANMSHELRTPLNAIIGFIGIMLMSNRLSEKDLYRAERIRANGERLLALIDEILDLSRIESGRLHLVAQDINVREALSDLEGHVRVLADEKSLSFSTAVADDVPLVIRMDPDALSKIMTNLLSNAVKFTEQGSVQASIRREGENLVIAVTDTGIGIPTHMQEVIFERFRQVDDSSTRAHGGTGLGLAIVHHLTQTMNGKITVDSAVGVGSTFTVSLPVLVDAAQRVG